VAGAPAPVESAGRVIGGRYRIEEALGRGGNAAVYRVHDERTGQKLALKRAYTGGKRAARRALLEREYHTLAQLRHPRIIEVIDYGLDEQGPYYTMELLDGADLDKGGLLPWPETCRLLHDIASSLAILHSRGLLHRDVSSRNVRRTGDGHAKLIDFGAMASMGVVKDVVGTPPFTAPEVLQLQALDARADLFSLGALGYYLLVGRHAYPARRLHELRDVWRSRPGPPSRVLPDLPPALNALIMQLLALDRSARPQSAAEVMERLCAIADLPREERIEVSRAYLTTPTLVGRERVLSAVRNHMLSLMRGDGAALLIEGVAGSGRSRVLDACVLEAKLLGVAVVRADAADGASTDWGVARSLGSQLLALFPKEAMEVTRLSQDVLGHVLEGVRRQGPQSMSIAVPERSLLLRELREFVLALASHQRIVIAVDDLERIDEPSAALLAALADKAEKHHVILALAVDSDADDDCSASLRLLRSLAHRLELEALEPAHTEELMRSVFGEVENLQLCAARIHAIAQGNPRTSMELAQHLVQRGLARYEAGSWLMPMKLDEHDLPQTLAASLRSRLAELSEPARELCEVLSVTDGCSLAIVSYRDVGTLLDSDALFKALDELVAARVLIADGERYRFTQRAFIAVLREEPANSERLLTLHSRFADFLAGNDGDVLRRIHHLFQAQRESEATQLLCNSDLLARLPPLELLERGAESAERIGLLPRQLHQLRSAVLLKAALLTAVGSFRRWLPPVLAQLERDSGLSRYRELAELPEPERLAQALHQTQQHYLATAEQERVYSVVDAVRELARLSGATCSMATSVVDLELLESLPTLEPLASLSPAVQVVAQLVAASKAFISGHTTQSHALYAQVLARIAEPDRAALDEAQHERTRLGVQYGLALIDASFGAESTEERAAILEGHREMRVNAWRVRMLMHFNQGNAEAAEKCMRRAELLRLQDSLESRYPGASAGLELVARRDADDLLGVKNAVNALTALAERHPGRAPMLRFGQSCYCSLQGDFEGALAHVLAGLELAKPARHLVFLFLAAEHVRVLAELDRLDEALANARAYLAICEREQLEPLHRRIQLQLAHVLARMGQHDEALAIITRVVESGEQAGMAGLALGSLYEARARTAIWMRDKEAFEHFAELCAREYRKGKNPALSAKFARLMEDARPLQLGSSEPARALLELVDNPTPEGAHSTARTRILECVDAADRARCALTILLQNTDSSTGYLFGVHEHGVELLATVPEFPVEEGVSAWVHACVQAELSDSGHTTADGDEGSLWQESCTERFADRDGRSFEAILVSGEHDEQERIAAVLVIEVMPGPRTMPPTSLRFEIAGQLLALGDVQGALLRLVSVTQ
jgi:tetratricopeptide (TPR) repeat protein